jgi:hypothetical protein
MVLIFKYIVPLTIFHSFLDGIIKGGLAAILVLVWLFLFFEMQKTMVRTQLRIEKDTTN